LLQHTKEIIQQGDESGNGMVVRFQLPSGLDIYGLPTKNFYGGHWDLGPTWNYVVMADKPFLVDSGRYGQGKHLVSMMESIGLKPVDLDFVLISHSHEDHDGGLAELIDLTDLNVKAHAIYDLLIKRYPDCAPADHRADFPARCWHCPMPESFYTENCLDYHRVLQGLKVDRIGDGETELGPDMWTHHLPGHSPDCLAVKLGCEAIIVGDVILPHITPWPTREEMYAEVAPVIAHEYPHPKEIFGLERYVKSLKKLMEISQNNPDLLVFPAHRLYYRDQWHPVELPTRLIELFEHHSQRCAAILEIIDPEPKTAEQIAEAHFEERLLKGFGKMMATNEIISHCELLMASGDLVSVENHTYAATGSNNFEGIIR